MHQYANVFVYSRFNISQSLRIIEYDNFKYNLNYVPSSKYRQQLMKNILDMWLPLRVINDVSNVYMLYIPMLPELNIFFKLSDLWRLTLKAVNNEYHYQFLILCLTKCQPAMTKTIWKVKTVEILVNWLIGLLR